MGIRALNRVIIRPEQTGGSATLGATIGWRGEAHIKDDTEPKNQTEFVGRTMPTLRPYVSQKKASCAFVSMPASYEHLMYILDAGVEGGAGVADGAGTGYVHSFDYNKTTAPSVRTYLIFTGDNSQAYKMAYSFVESFSLTAAVDDALMMEAQWIGRQRETTTFPALPTYYNVETILGKTGSFYIDEPDGTIGTTQITGTLLKWGLSVTTGWKAKFTVDDGQLYFNYAYFDIGSWKADLSMTYEHDSNGLAEQAKYVLGTMRLVRIQIEGSALTTPDTETNKRLTIDCAGYYTSFSELKEQEGNNIVECSMTIGYDTESAEGLNFVLVNEVQRTAVFA